MSDSKVVNVGFFTIATLPPRLEAVAREQGAQLGSGLIVVKTKSGLLPSYEFDSVGTSPEDIQNLIKKLAEEDGADLGNAVKKAFSEGLPQSSASTGRKNR